jgi:hypothetical protein
MKLTLYITNNALQKLNTRIQNFKISLRVLKLNTKLKYTKMKSFLFLPFILIPFSLIAQTGLGIGKYDSTYYHVKFSPSYRIEDTVYTPGVVENISHSVPLDLNNNGIYDLKIKSLRKNNYYPRGQSGTYPYWASYVERINNSINIISLPNDHTADTLSYDYITTNTDNWVSSSTYYLAYNLNNFDIDNTWKDKSGYYIGFRIGTSYGWIQLEVDDYYIINLVEYACQSSNPKDTIIDPAIYLSIKQEYIDDLLTIYPNPIHDKLNIVNQKNGVNIKLVEIYSIEGELLISEDYYSSDVYINTSELKKGVFILRVYLDNNSIINSKVVK